MDGTSWTIIDLKETILENNDRDAEDLRGELRHRGLYYINIMSSPGSGKTTTLTRLISGLRDRFRLGVMEADIDGDVDTRTIAALGIPAVQLHTGGMCHLDAQMSRQAMTALGTDGLDAVFLENVGNLVCPAEFDTGAHLNLVILSVPEGDDKPLKYPLMFRKADVIAVNKIDASEAFDFDLERFRRNLAPLTAAPVFPISALTGEGCEALCGFLADKIGTYREENSHA